MKNIALIGGGANGVGFVRGLLINLQRKIKSGEITQEELAGHNWSLHIFEKSTLIGLGFPYDSTFVDPEHLLNVKTKSRSIPDQDNDIDGGDIGVNFDTEGFLSWMKDNKEAIEAKFAEILKSRREGKLQKICEKDGQAYDSSKMSEYEERYPSLFANYEKIERSFKKYYLNFESGNTFHPRFMFGMYNQMIFDRDVGELEKLGVRVVPHPATEVVNIERLPGQEDLKLTFKTGSTENEELSCSDVMLATGRFPEVSDVNSKRYLKEPWPASNITEAVERVVELKLGEGGVVAGDKKSVRIAIEGSRLSAVDFVKTIVHDYGYFDEDGAGKLKFTPFDDNDYNLKIDMLSRTGLIHAPESDNLSNLDLKISQAEIDNLRESPDQKLRLWQIMEKVAQKLKAGYEIRGFEKEAKEVEGFLSLITANKKAGGDFDYSAIKDQAQKLMDRLGANPIAALRSNLDQASTPGVTPYSVFQAVYKQLDALTFIKHLSTEDEELYQDHFRGLHVTQSVRMPPHSAKELIALHEAGILDICGMGKDIKMEIPGDSEAKIKFSGTILVSLEREYDLVINARGFASDIKKHPLSKRMIDNGLISDLSTFFRTLN